MPDFADRHPLNAPGKYYTDSTCAECGGCRVTLPNCIQRDNERCNFYIARQPATAEEINLAEECVAACPHEAMGNDGDQFDWGETLSTTPSQQDTSQRQWWKFW